MVAANEPHPAIPPSDVLSAPEPVRRHWPVIQGTIQRLGIMASDEANKDRFPVRVLVRCRRCRAVIARIVDTEAHGPLFLGVRTYRASRAEVDPVKQSIDRGVKNPTVAVWDLPGIWGQEWCEGWVPRLVVSCEGHRPVDLGHHALRSAYLRARSGGQPVTVEVPDTAHPVVTSADDGP
jgi:hypothetical protein